MNDKSGSKLQASNMARNHVISKSEEGFSHQNLCMLKWEMCWNLQCSVGLCCIPRLCVADGAPDAAVFFSRRIRHFLNYVSELMSCTHSHTHTHMLIHTPVPVGTSDRQSILSPPGLLTACYIHQREREKYMNCTVYSRTQRPCKTVCDYHCLSLIILIWKVYYHIIRTPPVVYGMCTECSMHICEILIFFLFFFFSD